MEEDDLNMEELKDGVDYSRQALMNMEIKTFGMGGIKYMKMLHCQCMKLSYTHY